MYGFGYEADCDILDVDATGLLTDMPARLALKTATTACTLTTSSGSRVLA